MEIADNVVSGNAGKGVALGASGITSRERFRKHSWELHRHRCLRASFLWAIVPRASGIESNDELAENHDRATRSHSTDSAIRSAEGSFTSRAAITSIPRIRSFSAIRYTTTRATALLPDRALGIELVGRRGQTDLGARTQLPIVVEIHGINPPTNFPVLTDAVATESAIRLRGVLDGRTGRSHRIEFFASPACDPSGYGEGKTFLGSRVSRPGTSTGTGYCFGEFDVTLPVAVEVGEYITATATDLSTSEFSPCVPVEAAPAPEVVNQFATMVSLTQTRSHAPVTGGPAGTMTIRATFKNTSSTPIDTPFFVVTELSEGNVLLNADGSPSGVGAKLTADVGADKLFSPGESFTTEFVVGLHNRRRFRFFVDLWGQPIQ